ncbi:calsequestrin-1-like [Ptychodera flava]|uniref:calsequestrin-1-like n=1 Tax=Ptychodera flava TaxID=63121 RepID=UPI00396A87EC
MIMCTSQDSQETLVSCSGIESWKFATNHDQQTGCADVLQGNMDDDDDDDDDGDDDDDDQDESSDDESNINHDIAFYPFKSSTDVELALLVYGPHPVM